MKWFGRERILEKSAYASYAPANADNVRVASLLIDLELL
jgi:hypothetical protein